MKSYVIRINTIDNLYTDYVVEANNLFEANMAAKEAFCRDYEGADENIKLSLNPAIQNILEIINIIGEDKKNEI